MPPEVAITGTVDKRAYCIGPARVGQAGEPFLHRRLDPRKQVPATQGIAVVANGFRDQLQKATDAAPVGWECVAVPWHLARVTQ
jgi:hypothetical protein